MFRKKLDLSMLKDAGDADVDARASEELLEELRDARWDALPSMPSKVENLNRRLRRVESKLADGVEAKAKKAMKVIAAIAVAVAAAVPHVERFLVNYHTHGDAPWEQRSPSSAEKLTLDRVPPPDGGTHPR